MKYFIICLVVALAACGKPHDGQQGPKGDAGATGASGQSVVGPQGNPGTNGVDATPITFVKFCSESPVYPSTFPEFAICQNGKLFGIYSDHGGFLAELPDGVYSSNGENSTCTFTITGCTVTH